MLQFTNCTGYFLDVRDRREGRAEYNGTVTGMYGYLARQEIDVIAEYLAYHPNRVNGSWQTSAPFYISDILSGVTRMKMDHPDPDKIFKIYQPRVWYAIIASILMMLGAEFAIQRIRSEASSIRLENNSSIPISTAQPQRPKTAYLAAISEKIESPQQHPIESHISERRRWMNVVLEYYGALTGQALHRYTKSWQMYTWMLGGFLIRFFFNFEILIYLASFDYEGIQFLENLNKPMWRDLTVYVFRNSYIDLYRVDRVSISPKEILLLDASQ